jgi:mannose-6-phosphate isomerase-like protein (cupin superfamily)
MADSAPWESPITEGVAKMQTKSFDAADETRTPDKTRVEVVRLGDVQAARFTMEPGWRWSECVKPVAGTDSCRARHVGVILTGRMHVVQDDGTEAEVGAGEAYVIDPGHDAWVVGDDQLVAYEFDSHTAQTYATT